MYTPHATVLNLHQPLCNLEELPDTREWEARKIHYALNRIARALADYEDLAWGSSSIRPPA